VIRERNAGLQLTKIAARLQDFDRNKASGLKPLDAVEKTIVRDYTGRTRVESVEQRVAGIKSDILRRVQATWDALGDDWLGFFQDSEKVKTLVRALRGEKTGDQVADQGAKAFHDAAEEARVAFNRAGGDVGKLDDWGMPQHHSQEKVAIAAKVLGKGGVDDVAANRKAWVDYMTPKMLKTAAQGKYYTDEVSGQPWAEDRMREFLSKAWDTIATNGIANLEPGVRQGRRKCGEPPRRAPADPLRERRRRPRILEHFRRSKPGGNPERPPRAHGARHRLHRALRPEPGPDLQHAARHGAEGSGHRPAAQAGEPAGQGSETRRALRVLGRADQAVREHKLFEGRRRPRSPERGRKARRRGHRFVLRRQADVRGGLAPERDPDDPALEHRGPDAEPGECRGPRALERQGLMLESVRSGLNRFYEGLGGGAGPASDFRTTTGKFANAVMRLTGMTAINELAEGRLRGRALPRDRARGSEGKDFASLADSDVRALRGYGITERDWNTWKLAPLETLKVGSQDLAGALTPEAIARIPEDALRKANIIGAADGPEAAALARREAMVKLLGIVNTESDFAIVTPGWKERAQFYSGLAAQRGTFMGEVARSTLQFKSFPWAYFQRGMDLVVGGRGLPRRRRWPRTLWPPRRSRGRSPSRLAKCSPGRTRGRSSTSATGTNSGRSRSCKAGRSEYTATSSPASTRPATARAHRGARRPDLRPAARGGLVQPLTAAKNKSEGKPTHLGAQTAPRPQGLRARREHVVREGRLRPHDLAEGLRVALPGLPDDD
jgi:hypothetical protein